MSSVSTTTAAIVAAAVSSSGSAISNTISSTLTAISKNASSLYPTVISNPGINPTGSLALSGLQTDLSINSSSGRSSLAADVSSVSGVANTASANSQASSTATGSSSKLSETKSKESKSETNYSGLVPSSTSFSINESVYSSIMKVVGTSTTKKKNAASSGLNSGIFMSSQNLLFQIFAISSLVIVLCFAL